MTTITDVFEVLEREQLTEVLVGGYLDRQDGLERFHLMTDSVYLAFGDCFVRCRAGEQDYSVTLDVVGELTCDFPKDDQDRFCVSSLYGFLLGDAYVARWVKAFRALRIAGAAPWAPTLAGCELRFEDGEVLSVEPMVPDGLRIANGWRVEPGVATPDHEMTWSRR